MMNNQHMKNNNESISREIATEIDSAMKAYGHGKGISQAKLSAMSGVPQPTISRLLKGKTIPETATLSKLTTALRTKPIVPGEHEAILAGQSAEAMVDPAIEDLRELSLLKPYLADALRHDIKSALLRAKQDQSEYKSDPETTPKKPNQD